MGKFCSNCGKELNEGVNFCSNCGEAISKETKEVVVSNYESENTNSLAIAGFVTAMVSLFLNFWGIVGIIATVLSAVAIGQVNRIKEKGKGLAIAGVIIGSFSILYGLFQIINSINYFRLIFY